MVHPTTQLAVAPKLRAQPMALPICRPKPVDVARDLGEQYCLIWVGRHQVVMSPFYGSHGQGSIFAALPNC